MSTTIAQSLKDGGSDFSKLVTLTITATSPDTETGYFLLDKASTASHTTSYADAELIAICSPEDINTYSTTPNPTSFYRSATGLWVFPDETKMLAALGAITADIANAVSAYRQSVSPSGIYTAATTGSLSSMPAFSDDL